MNQIKAGSGLVAAILVLVFHAIFVVAQPEISNIDLGTWPIYVNGSANVSEVVIENGWIILWNITTPIRFDNLNASNSALISFYGVDPTENDIRYGNGSIVEYEDTIKDINVSIPANSFILFGDNGINRLTLLSPENGTQDTDGVIRFQYFVFDYANITACSLYSGSVRHSTATSITNNATNLIEVASVNDQHPLYSDALNWKISCIDGLGNIENSSEFTLDTRPDTPSGGGGGGGPGTTSETDPILNKLPKFVNVAYPKEWQRGERVSVSVQAFNYSDNLYPPKKVRFSLADSGVILESTNASASGEVTAVLWVSGAASDGEQTIKVFVEDERIVEHQMKFSITQGASLFEELASSTTLDKIKPYLLYGGIVLVLLLAVSFILYYALQSRH